MNLSPEEAAFYDKWNQELSSGRITPDQLKTFFASYSDIQFPTAPPSVCVTPLTILYCDGMIDKVQLNEYMTNVCQYIGRSVSQQKAAPENTAALPPIEVVSSFAAMLDKLFTGCLIIFMEGSSWFWSVQLAKIPQRTLEESNTEISIKGPKDAFTEELSTNLSLIRKRLPTGLLLSEGFTVGSISKTKIALLYLQHKADPKMLAKVRKRLITFQTECIVGSGQLEQWLSDRTFSVFPLMDYIGRPDFVIETLLRGRFALIVDGSPMVLIGPSNFLELLKTPEDAHFPYFFVIFQRAVRLIGFSLSILLPGFYLAISSVNLDQIPIQLIATVVLSREGVPLPLAFEAFLLLFLFELLKEAGLRLPRAVGQTIGIVGGLIIGDALIRAGLASPTLLVVMAISAVSSFTLVNQSLSGTVSLLRVLIMIPSALLGVYGFFIAQLGILIYLCQLETFGLPYMEPVSSLRFKEWLAAFLYNPFRRKNFTAPMLKRKR
ncbi:spore germination protein [Paenibacillus silviterrae]|uniref:spore germination protein n=1 Tax=Paenibacillus silviterrae TaxID=3242194 RepID=UPI002543C744|nr:spore germination protein [Paenibacillus chinjuensis]